MPTPEDLYRELQDEEEEADIRYKQRLGKDPVRSVQKKEPNAAKAMKRYNEEIRPVLEARRRVEQGLPPTENPFRNAWARITGQDKVVQLDGSQIVEPSKGLVPRGPTVTEVLQEIAANPDKFRHLARPAPEVRPVEAKRHTSSDLPPPILRPQNE